DWLALVQPGVEWSAQKQTARLSPRVADFQHSLSLFLHRTAFVIRQLLKPINKRKLMLISNVFFCFGEIFGGEITFCQNRADVSLAGFAQMLVVRCCEQF